MPTFAHAKAKIKVGFVDRWTIETLTIKAYLL